MSFSSFYFNIFDQPLLVHLLSFFILLVNLPSLYTLPFPKSKSKLGIGNVGIARCIYPLDTTVIGALNAKKRVFSKMAMLDARSSEIFNYFLNLYKIRNASDIVGIENNATKKPKWYHQLPRKVLLNIFSHFSEHELQAKIMPVSK